MSEANEKPEMEWPKMPLMLRLGGDVNHEWHSAINKHAFDADRDLKAWGERKFMYTARDAAAEVPRLALVFQREREGKLAKTFRKCACCSNEEHITENFTTCCLGVKCRECPHLVALEKAALPPEQIDWLKAWTCVAHIIEQGGDVSGEGFVQTVDDRMFWDRLHESLASGMEEDPPEDEVTDSQARPSDDEAGAGDQTPGGNQ